mgnify:CR=1 FL=1
MGSEMCIRDRDRLLFPPPPTTPLFEDLRTSGCSNTHFSAAPIRVLQNPTSPVGLCIPKNLSFAHPHRTATVAPYAIGPRSSLLKQLTNNKLSLASPNPRPSAQARNDTAVFLLLLFCLLYTSDAADDMQCVDLGGRRIIKKY